MRDQAHVKALLQCSILNVSPFLMSIANEDVRIGYSGVKMYNMLMIICCGYKQEVGIPQ